MKDKMTVGILAHVDAGKTTLAEAMLFATGMIRKWGRVDHKDAFLDTDEMERSRGITIFSKQALLDLPHFELTLLDTPGHVDFGAEMERTLQVLDYCLLMISAPDGIQGYVETLWRLLRYYQVPVFLFINKMDQPGTDRNQILAQLKKQLSGSCVAFDQERGESFNEEIAVCDENLLESYLETGQIEDWQIQNLILNRQVFPCFFGSALKQQGVDQLLQGFDTWFVPIDYPEEFGGRVFKIARDNQGSRLTYLKVTGGNLRVRETIEGEKINQIRIYSGVDYKQIDQVSAGTVCALTGPSSTKVGQGLGIEEGNQMGVLEPVLTYQVRLPEGMLLQDAYLKLKELEEEIPELHIVWNENHQEIHAQVMGQVQMEILRNLIEKRFGFLISFDTGTIIYKETISSVVEGVGHYEPLRHYAEVHLLMEPGEPGSGIQCGSVCSEDILDKNWQKLILTHIEEKRHAGALTGSELTDVRISLLTGAASIEHTEGGDFRQATYRAVRQGLMRAESVLLEPVYSYRLVVPQELVGRAMTDIQKMYGSFEGPMTEGTDAVLTGTVPVSTFGDYQLEVTSYTSGRGRLTCSMKGYEPCHNQEEVLESLAYDPESDLDNQAGSVFCSHGAGFLVPWYQVEQYMHLESMRPVEIHEEEQETQQPIRKNTYVPAQVVDEKELQEIFERTYGRNAEGTGRQKWHKKVTSNWELNTYAPRTTTVKKEKYLLVDGYNIIFAWEELKQLAEENLDGARDRLADMMSNYQGYTKVNLILVYDAYKVSGGLEKVIRYHNIYVVYTREAETADQYIEKTVHRLGRKCEVTVATSDGVEQVIIMGQGGNRLSARDFQKEVAEVGQTLKEQYLTTSVRSGNSLGQYMPKKE